MIKPLMIFLELNVANKGYNINPIILEYSILSSPLKITVIIQNFWL
ncbi:hypothetical protein DSUL_30108 [Desulfovibrionales bacterium]